MSVRPIDGLKFAGDRCEPVVATPTCGIPALCLQRTAQAFGGVVGMMNGEVTPPGAVVVPEMMIRIVARDTDGCSHVALFFRSTHQSSCVQETKRAALNIRTARKVSVEELFV